MQNRIFQNKGLDAFTLKLIALIFMLLDHIHTYLGFGPLWLSLLPRFVAPLFVFFLVEGFFHTRSRKKYLLRLLISAIIMLAGNVAINLYFHNTDHLTGTISLYSATQGNNILWTLTVYLCVLILLEKGLQADGIRRCGFCLASGFLALISTIVCEGGIYLLSVLLLCRLFREKHGKLCTGIVLWSVILFAKAFLSYSSGATGTTLWGTLCFDNEWAMILIVPMLLLYNGEQGYRNNFSKWLFYVFYPVHLWILMIYAYATAR